MPPPPPRTPPPLPPPPSDPADLEPAEDLLQAEISQTSLLLVHDDQASGARRVEFHGGTTCCGASVASGGLGLSAIASERGDGGCSVASVELAGVSAGAYVEALAAAPPSGTFVEPLPAAIAEEAAGQLPASGAELQAADLQAKLRKREEEIMKLRLELQLRTEECAQLRYQQVGGNQWHAVAATAPAVTDIEGDQSDESPCRTAPPTTCARETNQINASSAAPQESAAAEASGDEQQQMEQAEQRESPGCSMVIAGREVAMLGTAVAVAAPGMRPISRQASAQIPVLGSRPAPGKDLAQTGCAPLVVNGSGEHSKTSSASIMQSSFSPVPVYRTRMTTPVRSTPSSHIATPARVMQYYVANSPQEARARSHSPVAGQAAEPAVRQGSRGSQNAADIASSPGVCDVALAAKPSVQVSNTMTASLPYTISPRATIHARIPSRPSVPSPLSGAPAQHVLVTQPGGQPQGLTISASTPSLHAALTPGFTATYGRASPPPVVGRT